MTLRIAFYGDDFTGSTDAMEALCLAGLSVRLFIDPPTPQALAAYPELDAIGIAGLSRTMTPDEMDAHLPRVFEALAALEPRIVHYKVCSTFDSSPAVGSIGHAMDIGSRIMPGPYVPLVVAAPMLGRYCAFANLFARSGGDSEIYRLDRHPTMSRHPVTPMDEADLTRHLARQTDRPVRVLDVLALDRGVDEARRRLNACIGTDAPVVLFDTITDTHLDTVGRLIWHDATAHRPLFIPGSSGLEYAMVSAWRSGGEIGPAPPMPGAGQAHPLLVISGSCSPVTARQIDRALAQGFAELPLPADVLREAADTALDEVRDRAMRLLDEGRSVIIHSSRGPDDPRLEAMRRARGAASQQAEACVGRCLGALAAKVVEAHGIGRVAITGGDTSGHVARALGIESLGFLAPIAPGSPLCIAHAPGRPADGRQFVFKGGQIGKDNFFERVIAGEP